MRNLNTLRDLTLAWSEDRGILKNGKTTTQALKLVSEVGELCDNVGKGRNIKDDIGDCLVVLTNLAFLEKLTLEECWEHAYEEIKDRKGHLNEHGNFIKEGDVAKEVTVSLINMEKSLFFNLYEFTCLLSDGSKSAFTFEGTMPQNIQSILEHVTTKKETLTSFKNVLSTFGDVKELIKESK